MQYTDNEAALIGGLISNYFLRPAVSAALKNSYIHVLEHAEAYDIVTNSRVLWSVQRIKEYQQSGASDLGNGS